MDRLRERFGAAGVSSLLVTAPANVRYLCGFTGSFGALLVREGASILFTDSRYTLQAEREAGGIEIETVSGPPALAAMGAVETGTRTGFEEAQLTVAAHRLIADAAGGGDLVPTRGLVESLRVLKDPGEVEAIEASLRVTEEALEDGLSSMREGMSEIDLAAEIEHGMRCRGAAGPAFESIVASGPRSAHPHARATGRPLAVGEPVVIDIGSMVGGYASDMTRTIFVGEAGSRGREVQGAVAEAVARALGCLRAGVEPEEVDRAARAALEEAGFGEHAFQHGTGHGVGLEVHEDPRIARGRKEPLEAGMVVTIEPGVYLPEWGGVRIEEMALVEQEGFRLLTRTPREIPAR